MIEYSSLLLAAISSVSCSLGILLGRTVPAKPVKLINRDWSIWDNYFRCPNCNEGFAIKEGSAWRKSDVFKYCFCGTHASKFITWVARWAIKDSSLPGRQTTYYWDWLPKEKIVEDIEEKKYSEKEFQLQLKTQLELSKLENKSVI